MKFALLITSLSFAAGASLTALVLVFVSSPPRVGKPVRAPGQNSPTTLIETATYCEPAASDSSVAGQRLEVELTGYKDQWEIRYLGRDDLLGTASPDRAGKIKVPVNANIRLHLRSLDFVYLLSLPQLNRTQIAVPGHEFLLDFRTLSRGTFLLHGDHLCGPPPAIVVCDRDRGVGGGIPGIAIEARSHLPIIS